MRIRYRNRGLIRLNKGNVLVLILISAVVLLINFWQYILIPLFILFALIPLIYIIWNNSRWTRIEELNSEVGISRKNAVIDRNGYLRWKENQRLAIEILLGSII